MRIVKTLALLSVIGAGFALAGCGDDFSCDEAENCNGSGTGGTDGGTGATGGSSGTGATGGTDGGAGVGGSSGSSGSGGDGGGTCDTSKSPSEESCLVDDKYAVFVSPSGNDSTDGSKGTPFGTIEKAMETAKAKGVIVIACNDAFTAPVSLTSAHEGVIVHGGFKCSDWSYESGKKTSVTPTAAGLALTIDGVSKATGFNDFAFTAKDGVAPGESSIAAFVKSSTNVRFRRVDFSAGKGADGKNGTLTPVTHETVQANLNGKDASGDTGGKLNACACPAGGQSLGGKGGDGGAGSATGGADGAPALGAGQGGTIAECVATNTGGKTGANAAHRTPAAGASNFGTLTSGGFAGSDGGNGLAGAPGQGGGGGAGSATSGGGGGGGCGGCGGAGATGGGAGGSSIALMVFDATVDTTNCTFTTMDAGKGGNGATGQPGATQVGFGGNKSGLGCGGGAGGKGGNGGAGGGGAGGLTVGVLHNAGSAITTAGATFTTGKAGLKGIGGVAGSNDGVAGDKKDTLTL